MRAILKAALLAAAIGSAAQAVIAPKPLFRDPVHDGAADPAIVWDKATRQWLMFYTNRRANLPPGEKGDVSWIHGTHIGIASSRDGAKWRYVGIAQIPESCTGATLWAPEIQTFDGEHHMWLTVVPGIFKDWNASRKIVHLTSKDLKNWTCGETLDLGSDRVIDASVVKLPEGGYRIWFKDERDGSKIKYYDSPDLKTWTKGGTAIETKGEGPKVFWWRKSWWMVSDAWKGLLVARSDDAKTWTPQADTLLPIPGLQPTDRAQGQHPDVLVSGDRAYLYYFVHQSGEDIAKMMPGWNRRTVMQVTELHEGNGRLMVDREAKTDVVLKAPR